jgi:hypothetical protein
MHNSSIIKISLLIHSYYDHGYQKEQEPHPYNCIKKTHPSYLRFHIPFLLCNIYYSYRVCLCNCSVRLSGSLSKYWYN